MPAGFYVAVEILHMRLHSEKERRAGIAPELLDAGCELMQQYTFAEKNDREDYRLGEITKSCLIGAKGAAVTKDMFRHYCPRQPRIRRFGQGKPFILNTAPCQPRRRSPSSLRSCPKRIGSRRWAGNASKSGNSGRLRALGESLRPPEPGRRASSPVQKGGG